MNRLVNSWQMLKASWKVLTADKELLIFPLMSTLALMLVTAAFLVPLFFSNIFDSLLGNGLQAAGFVVVFLFYLVQYTVIFFANTALVGATLIRLHGGDPTIRDGLQIASQRFGPILGYALIAATVGMLLRGLSSRSKGMGRLVVSLLGTAWNIATYLVVPVLAVEGIGPIEAVKRSAALLRRTWGEQIAGNIGLGGLFALAIFIVLLLFAPLYYLVISLESVSIIGLVLLTAVLILIICILGLLKSTLEGIYSAAVYQYAVEGQSSGFFDENLVRGAFRSQ